MSEDEHRLAAGPLELLPEPGKGIEAGDGHVGGLAAQRFGVEGDEHDAIRFVDLAEGADVARVDVDALGEARFRVGAFCEEVVVSRGAEKRGAYERQQVRDGGAGLLHVEVVRGEVSGMDDNAHVERKGVDFFRGLAEAVGVERLAVVRIRDLHKGDGAAAFVADARPRAAHEHRGDRHEQEVMLNRHCRESSIRNNAVTIPFQPALRPELNRTLRCRIRSVSRGGLAPRWMIQERIPSTARLSRLSLVWGYF